VYAQSGLDACCARVSLCVCVFVCMREWGKKEGKETETHMFVYVFCVLCVVFVCLCVVFV